MAKDPKILEFLEAKGDVVENLEAIRLNLERCVEKGMLDVDDVYYNEIMLFIDEASISGGWAELEEVIAKAKTLEIDIAAWLAKNGKASISLPWPKRPKG